MRPALALLGAMSVGPAYAEEIEAPLPVKTEQVATFGLPSSPSDCVRVKLTGENEGENKPRNYQHPHMVEAVNASVARLGAALPQLLGEGRVCGEVSVIKKFDMKNLLQPKLLNKLSGE
ncbi:MAG: hypothetical protein Q8P27_02880 [Candidatus Peregrinibacteria bacterium]|nr:hypothetical protein [Candidatus Peregrinibacteria bacterium]